ncbi:TlpA disulfide reductase family protein [Shewanella sp. Isolate11]|uniref:TlpA disulfide reductase family protein n=1 Tax=Shewanella sp. Isolate11 TaxID=2908530 RepID=UPI001EFD33D7|nr:TlpA disulfide reductase family protein [Shewanella sp. Isolate11]MCG9698490.1 TlpA family protein disulfide reductase [Shewanella sp. Isolate11]
MSKLGLSILCACLLSSISLLPNEVQAYPGMQKKAQGEIQSSVELINILPKPFPIELVSFKDAAGKEIDFSQYRGKVVMINMWATWCPPCVRELPALDRFKGKFDPAKFTVLPISIDQNGKQQVEPFLQSLEMGSFETYYDQEQALGAVFPLDTIPATFILNKQGELIAFVRTFVDWDDAKAVELINSFLDK